MNGVTWRVWAASGLVAAFLGIAPPPPAGAATSEVTAGGTRFNPARVQVVLGDSIVWEAADDGHTVTARDGSFDSSSRGLMDAGDQYRYRFRIPGTYAYFCRVHQNRGMVGEVTVLDPSAPTTTTTRLTPVSAAATTSTATTATTAPTTTTTRPLATSSSTSPKMATPSSTLSGTPVDPQEPPVLDPNTRIVGSSSGASSSGSEQDVSDEFPEAQAASRTSDSDGGGPGTAVAAGLLAALGLAAGAVAWKTRHRVAR